MKICALQGGPCTTSIEENTVLIERAIIAALDEFHPELIICSELMNVPYFAAISPVRDAFFEYAETIDGPTVTAMTQLAKTKHIHIVGTYFEKEWVDEQWHYYNTAFVCSPTRGVIGQYRKVHVPKVIDATMVTDEKYYFEQFGNGGTAFPTFTLDNGLRIGILICFDRSFPEAWRSLTLQGVDLVCVPTATYGYRQALYIAELQVRALENNVYVAGVNKAGTERLEGEQLTRTHFGLSCLINPFGDVITVAGDMPFTAICAHIDLKEIQRSKQRVHFLAERKPHTYVTEHPV